MDGLVEYAGSRLLCTLEDIRCDDYDMPSESRETYIDFHYPRRNASRVHLTIPEGYVVEDVPPDHELSRNFAIFRSVYRQDEGMISFERDIEIPFSRYTERDAEDFNKCFGDMYAASDQPIILKREDSDE